MAFSAAYTELIFHYPLVSNLLSVIRTDFADALAWAKTKNGYAGATPVFATHLQCADLSEDTLTPAIALHPIVIEPELSLDAGRHTVQLAINAMLMLSGGEVNDLSHKLDTYVLALAQLWHSTASGVLFAGYHASARAVGGNRREIVQIPLGEDDQVKVRKGKYFRTALIGLLTSYECA